MPSRAGKRRHNRHWERLEAPGRGARAAAYLRYSSDMQSPHTITVQRRMCLEYAAKQGWWIVVWHVGDVPFGYLPPQYPKAPDDGTASWRPPRMPIVPDPKNWPALQLIADLRCKKWSAREIAEELNALGYRTSGRKRVGPKHARTGDHLYSGTRLFNADNVRAILNNPLYSAYEPGCEYGTIITPSGLRVKGQHKVAWDYSTWQRMQQVAEELYLAPHSTAVSRASYPLAGIITCFVCGEAMRSWHTHRKGREYRYYTC